jgi:apolipoprotein N-acyltransferase
LAFSFPKWGLFPLAWVALVPLLYSTRSSPPRQAFFRFLLAGWLFHSLVLQWLLTNTYWAGGWAVLGQQVLCLILGLYWGFTGALWAWLGRSCARLPRVLVITLLWMSMEFTQAHLFTGFGWTALAHSQGSDLALLQWAAIGGAPLVAALLVAANALAAQALAPAFRTKRALMGVGAALLIGISHLIGAQLMDAPDYKGHPLKAGIFQSNFPLEMKWDPEYTEEMVRNAAQKSATLAQHQDIDLLVWPETLIMDSIDSPAILGLVTDLTQGTGAALFTGAQGPGNRVDSIRNASHLIDASGVIVGHYDKIHLAPFGEYAPLDRYFPFVRELIPAISDIEPGDEPTTFPIAGRNLGPLICFEVVFPDMAEELRSRGADFLVVITNLGWFGASNALAQEIDIARLRAIETRLPLIHCANTGISGVFDPWGRFTGLDASSVFINRHGQQVTLYDEVSADDLNQYRCAGALPVAAPGRRPVPWNPQVIAPLAIALLLIASFCAFALQKRQNRNHAKQSDRAKEQQPTP